MNNNNNIIRNELIKTISNSPLFKKGGFNISELKKFTNMDIIGAAIMFGEDKGAQIPCAFVTNNVTN